MIIKRIEPISLAKISGILYAIGGLLGAVFVSLASTLGAFAPKVAGGSGLTALGVLGLGSLIIFPILYGVIGFVSALIAAWIYNSLAHVLGGIRLEVE